MTGEGGWGGAKSYEGEKVWSSINHSMLSAGPAYRAVLSEAENSAGILEQSMGARNRVGIGLSYRPAWLHVLAESIPSK
jgi:hypothetical protein